MKAETMEFTDEYKDRVYNWARQKHGNSTHGVDNGKPVLILPGANGAVLTAKIGDSIEWNGEHFTVTTPVHYPVIESEKALQQMIKYRAERGVHVGVDGKSDYALAWRQHMEWVERHYNLTPISES